MLDSALSVMSVLTRTGYLHRKKRPSAPTACEKRSGSSESATKERCSTALLFLWELQRIRITPRTKRNCCDWRIQPSTNRNPQGVIE
jgi:hypothetical protein